MRKGKRRKSEGGVERRVKSNGRGSSEDAVTRMTRKGSEGKEKKGVSR